MPDQLPGRQINTLAAASSIRLSKTNLVAVICRNLSDSPPGWGSIELCGKYLVGAAGLGALLPVEPVAQDGGMTVDLLAHSHDVAESSSTAISKLPFPR